MTPGQFKRVEQLYFEAVKLPATERDGFLKSACGDDADVRAEVAALLEQADKDALASLTRVRDDVTLAAKAASSEALVGQRIGNYHILGKIGEGGMGIVYEAEQEKPVRRRVALKLIKVGMDTHEVIARFETERQTLALMDHPNVARVYDAGATDAGRPYFVMEFVRGVPINQYCDRQRLTTRQRLALFEQACNAIQHAHQKGIIHRDISSSNILVATQDDQPTVKVIDFGVAKATNHLLTQHTVFTERGQFVGKPEYMSPEQADPSIQDIDTRSDIYSLGVLLYELLTGTLPFDSKTLRKASYAELQRIIREVDPPKPSTKLSSGGASGDDITATASSRRTDLRSLTRLIRGDLDWIVMKCLEKDRSRRYESAHALVQDLRRHLGNEPVLAGPPSVSYRLRKFVRRNRGGVLVGAVTAITLIIATVVATEGLVRARRAERAAEERRAEAERERRTSEAVVDFLSEDVIGSANPMLTRVQGLPAPGPDLTLREVLDTAAARVEEDLSPAPAAKSVVQRAIGMTYLGLSEFAAAQSQLEAAQDAARESHGAKSAEYAEATNALGVLHLEVAHYEEAQRLFLLSLDLYDTLNAGDDERVAEAMYNLAETYRRANKFKRAKPLYEESLRMRQRGLGDRHPKIVESLIGKGAILFQIGQAENAMATFEEAVQLGESVLGEAHPRTAEARNDLAVVLFYLGKLARAEALHIQNLDTQRERLGEGHVQLAWYYQNLGITYFNTGRAKEAEPLLRRSWEIRSQKLGEAHYDTAIAAWNLGRCLMEFNQFAEAESLLAAALAVYQAYYGEDHSQTLLVMLVYGQSLSVQGKLSEAVPVFQECLERCRDVFGDNHHRTWHVTDRLAWALLSSSRYSEAEPLLRESVKFWRENHPDDRPRIIHELGALARSLIAQGKLAESSSLCNEIREMLSSLDGPRREGTHRIAAVVEIGAKLIEANQPGEAEALLRAYLEAQSHFPKLCPRARAESLLAECLVISGRYAEAEPLLLGGHAGLESEKGTPARQVQRALERTVALYEAWNKPEKAGEWRAKLAELEATTQPATPGSVPSSGGD